MQRMLERCAGLDAHQATVVVCLLISVAGMRPRKEIRTFGTMTYELEELRDWLEQEGVTHVGMESTGVYWRPVYAVLEGHFELIVGNARHIRNVPGRKTDVKDAEWIAELVCHGLIQPSFVPAKPLRALRELLRYRRKLVEGQSAERNRLHQARWSSGQGLEHIPTLLPGGRENRADDGKILCTILGAEATGDLLAQFHHPPILLRTPRPTPSPMRSPRCRSCCGCCR